MTHSEQPQFLPGRLALPEEWLDQWMETIFATYPQIEQVYLLGGRARGPQGQKPDYSLLLYAGYDNALELMTSLAREEEGLRPTEAIVHLYIENYGATFCGIWGGALIPNEFNRDWEESRDYLLWKAPREGALPLAERLRLPLERRRRQRREAAFEDEATFTEDRDQLQPVWQMVPRQEDRRKMDRRRIMEDVVPLLEDA